MNPNAETAIRDFVESIIPATMHAGYWFTLALFQTLMFFLLFKILTQITLKIIRFSKEENNFFVELFWAITIIVLVCYLISPIRSRTHEGFFKRIGFSQVTDLLPYFFIGYLLSRKKIFITILRNPWVFLVSVCVYTLFFYDKVANDHWQHHRIIIISGLIVLYNVVTNLHFKAGKETISPLFIHIGKNILPIYLVHYFLLPELPMVKDVINQIESPYQIFLVETTLATLNALFVIGVSLLVIKIIRLNKYLAFFLLGNRLPKLQGPQ